MRQYSRGRPHVSQQHQALRGSSGGEVVRGIALAPHARPADGSGRRPDRLWAYSTTIGPALSVSSLEIVVVSKAELTGSDDVRRRLEQDLGRPVLAISAVTGQGLSDLVRAVVEQLQELPAEAVT